MEEEEQEQEVTNSDPQEDPQEDPDESGSQIPSDEIGVFNFIVYANDKLRNLMSEITVFRN